MEGTQDSKGRILWEDTTQWILLITEEELNLLMISKDLMNSEILFSSRKFQKDLSYQEGGTLLSKSHPDSEGDSGEDSEEGSEVLGRTITFEWFGPFVF